ncbi:MAG: hypothetical protein S0880_33140 [Actinomycetota bacterium]|nr:hypothetical protein [Actinomycetota bacterium]
MRERRIAVMDRFQRLSIRFWAALTVSGALTSAVAAPLGARALDARELATDVRLAAEPADLHDWDHSTTTDDDGASGRDEAGPAGGDATTTSSVTPSRPDAAGATTTAPATTVPPTAPPTTKAPPLPPAPTTTTAPATTTAPPPTTAPATTTSTTPTTAATSGLGGVQVVVPGPDEPALAVELWLGPAGATTVPLTEAACRDGGWATSEVDFTSEQQCLAFVDGLDPTIAASVDAGVPLTDLQLASLRLHLDLFGLLEGLLGGVLGLLD